MRAATCCLFAVFVGVTVLGVSWQTAEAQTIQPLGSPTCGEVWALDGPHGNTPHGPNNVIGYDFTTPTTSQGRVCAVLDGTLYVACAGGKQAIIVLNTTRGQFLYGHIAVETIPFSPWVVHTVTRGAYLGRTMQGTSHRFESVGRCTEGESRYRHLHLNVPNRAMLAELTAGPTIPAIPTARNIPATPKPKPAPVHTHTPATAHETVTEWWARLFPDGSETP